MTEVKNELRRRPPKYPRTAPPYQVYWEWDITYRCNYRCSYCSLWPKGEKEKYFDVDPGRWRDIWDGIFEKYWSGHIRFSGGEPTVYPNFFALISQLLRKHTVDITTNLSFDIADFTKKVKPGGISISASFHPEFVELKSFLKKVLFLHHNGYPSTICFVAYPPHLERLEYYKSLVEEKGIIFKVISFSGKYRGREYPRDYPDEERKLIEGVVSGSQDDSLNELNTRWYEWNAIKRDKEEGKRKKKLCRMGEMVAIIRPDGKVTRCCAYDSPLLGNISDPDFRLLDAPAPCEAERCPCFKAMLVGDEEERWLPLWEALDHPVYQAEYIKRFISGRKA